MNRPIRLANTFHELASPFLSGLNFQLDNDPNQLGHYMGSRADYRTENGFFLAVGFNPLDGSNAGMKCGRAWDFTSKIPKLREFRHLSHEYAVLAARFGFELPRFYPLDVNDDDNADLQRILDDLKASLPVILERLTLSDLIAIEEENYGSCWHHQRTGLGTHFAGITPFTPSQNSD